MKGSPEIVGLMQKSIEENGLADKVILQGSFCIGKFNRVELLRRLTTMYVSA